jgi:hypothetical protein
MAADLWMRFIKRKSLETGQKSGSRKCVDIENCSHSHLLEPRFRMTFWITSRIVDDPGIISSVATLSVNKVAVTTNGSMILTLNSSGSFSLALRGHCAPPRRCARRTKFDLETSRKRTTDRVETWTPVEGYLRTPGYWAYGHHGY